MEIFKTFLDPWNTVCSFNFFLFQELNETYEKIEI